MCVLCKVFGDMEHGVSWINPPLKESAKTRKNIDNSCSYTVFIRDCIKSKETTLLCRKWSKEDFESSGYVRCRLTPTKLCYAKPYRGLMSFIKDKGEILFSFEG